MSSNDARELFIDPMRKVCRRPSGTDETALLEIYLFGLANIPREHLRAAWERMKTKVAGKFWPSVDDIREACRTVEAVVHAEKQKAEAPPEWSDETIMRSDIGQIALRESWGRDLLIFARKHHRRPQPHEVGHIRATAVHAAAMYQQYIDKPTTTGLERAVINLGSAMMAHERKLRMLYLDPHGVA